MPHLSLALTGRVSSSIKRWLDSRKQEFVHCCECGGTISPWDSHCPTCGQADPSRVPASVGVYLVLAFIFLALIVSLLIFAL